MSIASEITRIQNNIAEAYDACEEKGAAMPQTQNSANLADTIGSITGGGASQAELRKERVKAMLPAMYWRDSNKSLLVNNLTDYFVDQNDVDLQASSRSDAANPEAVAIVNMQGIGTFVRMLYFESDRLIDYGDDPTFYVPDTNNESYINMLITGTVPEITDTTVTLSAPFILTDITATTEMSVDLIAVYEGISSGTLTQEYTFTADFKVNGTSISQIQIPCSIVLGKF
ncbi:MAG: hypothetical protein IJ639_03635 [Ruminococcus sp.]|nr:hypothetical protein [Ruminococcus sp.]